MQAVLSCSFTFKPMSTPAGLIPDKREVRRSFERAAATYDSAAVVDREIADRMFARLDYVKIDPKRILDAGCRTGHGVRKLASRYSDAAIIGVDVAYAMTRAAQRQLPWWKRHLPL